MAEAKNLRRRPAAPLGASMIVISSFFYASYGIWTKLLGNFLGGYTASAIRSVLVLAIMLPIALAYRKFSALDWHRNGRYIVGMFIASLFTWGPLFFAIQHAGVGISLTISYAGIIISTFVFGWMLCGERYTRDKLISTILSFVGLWLVFSPNVEALGWLALAAAAVSGLSAGANGVMAKRLSYNATQSTVMLWTVSFFANALMALLIRENWPQTGWHVEWVYLVGFAVSSVLASWSFVWGLKVIEAGAAGILGLLEVVFAVFFGIALFGEHIGLLVWGGVAVIIGAAAIPYIRDYNEARGTLEDH